MTYAGESSGGDGYAANSSFIFKPGSSNNGNQYNTWSTLWTAVGLTTSAVTILIDSSLGTASIPSGTYNFEHRVYLSGNLARQNVLELAEGSNINNLCKISNALTIDCKATSVIPMSLSDDSILILENNVILKSTGSVSALDVTGDVTIHLDSSKIVAGTVEAITLMGNTTLTLVNDGYGFLEDISIKTAVATSNNLLILRQIGVTGFLSTSQDNLDGLTTTENQNSIVLLPYDGTLDEPYINTTDISNVIPNIGYLISGKTLYSDISSGATTVVSENIAINNRIEFRGILTADKSIVMPLMENKKWELYNATTGAFAVTAIGATGTGVYLPRGSITCVETDQTFANIIYSGGSQGGGITWLIPIELAGTTNNTDYIKLPTNFKLVRAEFRTKTTIGGGGSATLGIGTASGGITILTDQSVGVAGTLIGDLTSQLGSDMLSTRGYEAFYTTAQTIWVKKVITGNVSSGAVNLYLAGYMV